MAELVLSAVLPLLFERLASPEILKFAMREKVRDLVNKWETKLRDISMFLEDAENKVMRGSDGRVQPWLEDLKDLAYDIDDVVDEFITEEGIRSLSKENADAASSSKVRSLLVPGFLSPGKLKFDYKLRSRMKEIDGRLKLILDRKRDLGLNEGSSGGMMKGPNLIRSIERLTTSLPEYYVVGREDDERAILAKLLQETGDQHLSVIPIVGMGGVGKTTLARSVFNKPDVVKAFPQRGWACVSDNFDMVGIARALLGSLTGGGGNVESSDLNVLHNKLGEILSKQKCLVVLDDYWNENYNDWVRLSDLFNLGVKGSKIIVTTRLANVVSLMQTDPTYHRLQELSTSDCLSLLAYHALGGSSFDAHPHLKAIGEKIAVKCAGLPLAAKTLGGLLRSKSTTSEWQYILESEIWNLPQGSDGILPALKLSYFHLPSYAKRCFTFCAIFPQDYEFNRNKLVQLWMAEGLVDMDPHMPRRSMRDQGLEQFNLLLNMSFFQRSSQNESRFVMHDLMHDLATSVGGTTYLNVGKGEFDCVKTGKSLEKVRHLSYVSTGHEVSARFEKCQIFKGLRTFVSLPATASSYGEHALSYKEGEKFLQKLKYSRALSFGEYFMRRIPDSICYLKHLRYLNFYACKIKELPGSICSLYNLETLILKRCRQLTDLPHGIEKLINLRCLDIRDTDELKKLPVGLGRLHRLEILSKYIVGKEGELRLKELKCFKLLQEELIISDLQNVEEIEEARDAELISKVGLTALTFVWDIKVGSSSRNADKEMQVLNLLQPQPNIKEMNIHGFGGTSFPHWIGSSSSLVSIDSLELSKCRTTKTLPSLGLLPSLRVLKINEMDAVCTVGPEFFGTAERSFQSLEVLEFEKMVAWESWCFSFGNKEIDQPFPRLKRLKLVCCPKLVSEFLHQLSSLIDIQSCPILEEASSPCMTDLPTSSKNNVMMISHQLEVLVICGCPSLKYLINNNMSKKKELRMSLAASSNLKRFVIKNCGNVFDWLLEGGGGDDELGRGVCASLEKIDIAVCKKKEFMLDLSNPKKLEIENCGNVFDWLLEGGDEDDELGRVCIEEIFIEGCNVKRITHRLDQKFTNLTELTLSNCPYLEVDVFPKLPSCLESLCLATCHKIKSLPAQQMQTTSPSSLQTLQLLNLSIESFPKDGLPRSLELLIIVDCKELRQPMAEWGLNKLTALKTLHIEGEIGCLQGMTCFPPSSDWLVLPPNLKVLGVSYQQDLVRLSNGLRNHLTSLQTLSMYTNPKLQFLPKEGFPPSILFLTFTGCSQALRCKLSSSNGQYFPLIERIPHVQLP